MSITAMKQALEALEYPLNKSRETFNVDMSELISHGAITALRQAIEQLQNKRPRLDQGPDYERGFIDGMQQQMQSSVDKKVNAMSRQWVGLTDEEVTSSQPYTITRDKGCFHAGAKWANAKLKEKNT